MSKVKLNIEGVATLDVNAETKGSDKPAVEEKPPVVPEPQPPIDDPQPPVVPESTLPLDTTAPQPQAVEKNDPTLFTSLRNSSNNLGTHSGLSVSNTESMGNSRLNSVNAHYNHSLYENSEKGLSVSLGGAVGVGQLRQSDPEQSKVNVLAGTAHLTAQKTHEQFKLNAGLMAGAATDLGDGKIQNNIATQTAGVFVGGGYQGDNLGFDVQAGYNRNKSDIRSSSSFHTAGALSYTTDNKTKLALGVGADFGTDNSYQAKSVALSVSRANEKRSVPVSNLPDSESAAIPQPEAPQNEIRINLNTHEYFAHNKYQLSEQGKRELDAFAQKLTGGVLINDGETIQNNLLNRLQSGDPYASVKIKGHADATGSASYNQRLSEKRVDAIVDYLVSKGVNKSILQGVAVGEKEAQYNDAQIAQWKKEGKTRQEIHQLTETDRAFKITIAGDFKLANEKSNNMGLSQERVAHALGGEAVQHSSVNPTAFSMDMGKIKAQTQPTVTLEHEIQYKP